MKLRPVTFRETVAWCFVDAKFDAGVQPPSQYLRRVLGAEIGRIHGFSSGAIRAFQALARLRAYVNAN